MVGAVRGGGGQAEVDLAAVERGGDGVVARLPYGEPAGGQLRRRGQQARRQGGFDVVGHAQCEGAPRGGRVEGAALAASCLRCRAAARVTLRSRKSAAKTTSRSRSALLNSASSMSIIVMIGLLDACRGFYRRRHDLFCSRRTMTVAVAQAAVPLFDTPAALARAEELVREGNSRGAEVVVLPRRSSAATRRGWTSASRSAAAPRPAATSSAATTLRPSRFPARRSNNWPRSPASWVVTR